MSEEEVTLNDTPSKRKRLKKISDRPDEGVFVNNEPLNASNTNELSEVSSEGEDNVSEEGAMEKEKEEKPKEKDVNDVPTDERALPRKKRGRPPSLDKPKARPRRATRRDSTGVYEEVHRELDLPNFVELSFKAAQRAGFNPIEMMPEERAFFTGYVEHNQPRFLDLRNMILYKWKNNVNEWLSLQKAQEGIRDEFLTEIETIWDFLVRHGHINVGIFQNWQKKVVFFTGDVPHVVVIGAGAAGLGCAQQLFQWGYKVTVLEARDRIGGRCRTSDALEPNNFVVDLGASIITGLIGNPLDNLTQQLHLRTHVIGTSALMLTETGLKIDKEVDEKMDHLFNNLLEKVATFKDHKGSDKSLGGEMENILPRLPSEDAGVLDWYYANLEYACAADLSLLSLNYWDQDDPFDFLGEHLMLVDGYASMLQPLVQGLDVKLKHKVNKVSVNIKGVSVHTDGGVVEGDVAVITVPLGVLKTDMITYEPPLPNWKRESIRNLGFGLLNKVAILFEEKFWDDDIDWFGKVITNNARENRGLCYLWWNYYKIVKRPVLVAIVAGKACHAIELRTDEDMLTEVLSLLQSMFKLPSPPKIANHVITRWKSDQFTGGSYSYVALGATGEDYDKLAKTVQVGGKNKLFFGGEHSCRQFPATVAGAYASGLREAEKVHRNFYPPVNSNFRPPPIQSEVDLTREKDRKRMVKKSLKENKSRLRSQFRRGVRHAAIGKSGNEHYKFNYQPLFNTSKQLTPQKNNSEKPGENSQSQTPSQYKKYDALLFKKRKRSTDDEPSKQKLSKSQDIRPSNGSDTSDNKYNKPYFEDNTMDTNHHDNNKNNNNNNYNNNNKPPLQYQRPNYIPGLGASTGSGSLSSSGGWSGSGGMSGGGNAGGYGSGHFRGGSGPGPSGSGGGSTAKPTGGLSEGNNGLQLNPYGSFRHHNRSGSDVSEKHKGANSEKHKKSPVAADLSVEMSDADDDEKGGISKADEKVRKEFRRETADLIVNRLSRYHKNGRIPEKEDFKHLSRKFTHKFTTWEDNNNGNYKMDAKKKSKMKKLIDDYFVRHKTYTRKKNKDNKKKK